MNLKKFTFFKKLVTLPFIEKIIIFGSRARGDESERSDIDLAIFCPQATARNWFDIIALIEDADTLLKIDCIRLDTLSPKNPIIQSIKNEGIILYERT